MVVFLELCHLLMDLLILRTHLAGLRLDSSQVLAESHYLLFLHLRLLSQSHEFYLVTILFLLQHHDFCLLCRLAPPLRIVGSPS